MTVTNAKQGSRQQSAKSPGQILIVDDDERAARGIVSAFSRRDLPFNCAVAHNSVSTLSQLESCRFDDNVQNAQRCHWAFDGSNLQDVRYSQFVQDVRDSMDLNYGCDNAELHYEVCTSGVGAYHVLFSIDTWPQVSRLLYCDSCSNGTSDCFGCVGLRRSRYSILNKQYSPDEYQRLLKRIIAHMQACGEWGEFFHQSISPFGYNESVAFEYYPLSRERALELGFCWRESPRKKVIPTVEGVPDTFVGIEESCTTEAYPCSSCRNSFRIIAQESRFLIRAGLPPPEDCFLCRHGRRMAQRNPRALIDGTCSSCGVALFTSHPAASPFKIVCQSCFERSCY